MAGKGPVQFFIENGFDIEGIGKKKVQSSLKRWSRIYNTHGELGFQELHRGKASTGRPFTKHVSSEMQLEKAKARSKYLETELELLKKLEELEGMVKK